MAANDPTEGKLRGLVGKIRRATMADRTDNPRAHNPIARALADGRPVADTYDSTCIDHTLYFPRSGLLAINFVKGKHSYDYFTVDQDTYQGLRDAESPGGYFNAALRDDHSIYRGQRALLPTWRGRRFR